ncbi:phage tail fiber protein [Bacillus sp. UMB0728]|uniref:phage tail fiber protein n=1 Tax=Bacillus sp. UMB0728 TaxID=2066052 RepID=UPI000C789AF1|nr:hypothetical protein [Bacillus sp. UMB0728]PLR72329.1 hypothetical protein CYJ37_12295 [Bacillus sp. UMB0728]
MSAISNYLENKLLDHVLKGTAYTPPSTLYVALFTTDPTDAGTGTEVSGGGYTRRTATFNTATNGSISTNADITFPVATANWGTVTHTAIFDAATGGNLLFHGALTASKTINIDDQLKISSGSLTVNLD